MKLIRSALWSSNAVLSRRFQSIRAFSASPFSVSDDWDNLNSSEPVNDSELRNIGDGIFGQRNSGNGSFEQRNSGNGSFKQRNSGNGSFEQRSSGNGSFEQRSSGNGSLNPFYEKLGKAEKARDQFGMFNMGNRPGDMNGLDENYNSLIDGMEYKLKKAASNVKFLANFITEAGIIIKRSQTGISAKAQRKIAREIKTAQAFGLMPFIAMGTKRFEYGKTMEDHDRDFEFEVSSYDTNFVDEDREDPMGA